MRGDALPATGLADDADRLAGLDLDGDTVDGLDDAITGKEVGLEIVDDEDKLLGLWAAGLLGKNITVTHFNDGGGNKVIIYRRWQTPGDDVMVIANFGGRKYTTYDLGLPAAGAWIARVDGDHVRYGTDLGAPRPTVVTTTAQSRDGLPFMGTIALGPYSLVVLTTIVLYLLACDPLPPCPGTLREWLRTPASSPAAAAESSRGDAARMRQRSRVA